MKLDYITIFNKLGFLTSSIRLQYTNFIYEHQSVIGNSLTLEEVLKRLKQSEPIEYIFKTAKFFSLNFYVDSRVLIPRLETEKIVSLTLDYCKTNSKESFTIIDIGTGSGAIILAIAKTQLEKKSDMSRYIGIDVSLEALDVAKQNAKLLDLEGKVEFYHSPFQEFDFTKYKNIIVCANLPYIPNKEKLQPSVYNYEPHLALFGGKGGDELNKELIKKLEIFPNIKTLFIEGYNGEVSSKVFTIPKRFRI